MKKITFDPLFLHFLKNALRKSEVTNLYVKKVWNSDQKILE